MQSVLVGEIGSGASAAEQRDNYVREYLSALQALSEIAAGSPRLVLFVPGRAPMDTQQAFADFSARARAKMFG